MVYRFDSPRQHNSLPMNTKQSLLTKISSVYAICLTSAQKKQLMGRIYREVHERAALSDENVLATCNYLNQCFEAEKDSIIVAMKIVTQLLSHRVAQSEVIKSYRKLLTYVSSVLDESCCIKIAFHFTSISTLALQSNMVSPDVFPVAILKCILTLMYRFRISSSSDRNIILGAFRSTLQWCKDTPELYARYGLGSLIRSAIASTAHLQDDLVAVTELITLVRHMLDVFYTPQTNDVHPVEVLLRSAYAKIFTRLVSEWTDNRCYEMLLYVLFDLLKREICLCLKLDIVRVLADTAGGGIRRLVRLLCVSKHMRNDKMQHKLKIMLTNMLANSLFQYESAKGVSQFGEFLKTIEQLVTGVDLHEIVKAKFLCLNLPRNGLTFPAVCIVFIVRHLDLLEGVTSSSIELDYVYNLTASVNIFYHKRWNIPNFLVKHFMDGLSRFSKSDTFEKSVKDPKKKLKAIFSTAANRISPNDTVTNIFGRLPVTVQRIQWIQTQSDEFQAKFAFQQQLGILQDRCIVPGDEGLILSLLTFFQTDTLISVLSAPQASPVARRNASVLLSKCSLTGPALRRVLRQLERSQKQQQQVSQSSIPTAAICNWVRAVHGSVQGLNDGSKRVLWSALSTIHNAELCTDEHRLLLVNTKARLLVSMMQKLNGTVLEMHIEQAKGSRVAAKRKLS